MLQWWLTRLCAVFLRVKEASCPKLATTSESSVRVTSDCRRVTKRWSGSRWTTSCLDNRLTSNINLSNFDSDWSEFTCFNLFILCNRNQKCCDAGPVNWRFPIFICQLCRIEIKLVQFSNFPKQYLSLNIYSERDLNLKSQFYRKNYKKQVELLTNFLVEIQCETSKNKLDTDSRWGH